MRETHSKVTFATLLVTLGIVFGDIGTSPLYVMTAILGKNPINRELVYGGLSCIFWTLTLQATFKYILLTLRADNHGEGGIFSLYALIKRQAPRWTVYAAMIGCSALLADGIITPAISLTASVEGLELRYPGIPVVAIVLIILTGLFTVQQFGTEKIGKSFGPIMVLWFSMLIVWGLISVGGNWEILTAVNPYYAFHILTTHPAAWLIIGAVFLCVTGAEALYSDLGHAGKKNIRLTWIFVKTALLVNYFGQGAWVLTTLENKTLAGINPFFAIMPKWFVAPGVAISVLASIVASQALISGSYSLISEAVKLDTWFRVQIRYPSRLKHQLFIPFINHLLFAGCVVVVLYFQKSANMEAAYGIAITIAMLATTTLLTFYLARRLKWHWWAVTGVTLIFLSVEGVFFAGNAQKIAHGAGISLGLMAMFFGVMIVHYEAKSLLRHKRRFVDAHRYTAIINAISEDKAIPKFASNIAYLTNARHPDKMEKQILKSIYLKQPKRADTYWLIHFSETEAPYQVEYKFHVIMPGKVYRLEFDLGYKVKPNLREMFPQVLKELEKKGQFNLENKYESLRRFHVPSDFLFIVMRNTFNLSSESSIKEIMLLNSYKLMQKISEPPEQYFGIDRNSLLVEYIALK